MYICIYMYVCMYVCIHICIYEHVTTRVKRTHGVRVNCYYICSKNRTCIMTTYLLWTIHVHRTQGCFGSFHRRRRGRRGNGKPCQRMAAGHARKDACD